MNKLKEAIDVFDIWMDKHDEDPIIKNSWQVIKAELSKNCNNEHPKPKICQVCGGDLKYYFHPFWGWIFGSCYRCMRCGRKWTDFMGPR